MCWFWPGNKDGSLFDVPISGRWPPLVLVQSPAHLHLYHGTFWNCHNMLCCSSPWLWAPTVLGLLCRSCCLIAQLCPTLCNSMDWGMPSSSVLYYLPEFTQIHVHWVQFSSVAQSRLTRRPHEPQHTRPRCPSPTPGVYPNSCPLRWWCHLTISSSVVPFSSYLQSFPISGSFQMSQLFGSGGQNIGVPASTSVLPMNIQDWFPFELVMLEVMNLLKFMSTELVMRWLVGHF